MRVLHLGASEIKGYLPPGVFIPAARYGVDAYRIVYRTVDVRGRSTTASGLVVLPRNDRHRLRPAVWLHGTQSFRKDAPSVSPCCDRAAAVLFASLGYAVTAPDYLGLGLGRGNHPYFHAPTMVSASVDAMTATRRFAAARGRTVAGPVAVSGFSQGANGAFLLAKALEKGPGVAALAPISGAYELFDVEWPAALDGKVAPKAATYYLAYITVAWNRLYHLYDDESEVFKAPYAGHVAALFDGRHTLDETAAGLPADPAHLLTSDYMARLRHPTGSLGRAARANDYACRPWRASFPIRMFAAHGDPEAVFENSRRCLAALEGGDVTLTDVGDVDHITSVVLSIPRVGAYLATLVKP
ncbi:hypothetical protein J5X84_22485 [Streptosporangiaceae bacterium NEAU-GS5]|nr:hypothetical protein [Streptosporangiaceae bacterium NEAU-GS5]